MDKLLEKIKQWSTGLIITGCLILGLVLRLDHLGLRPFWLDEAGSANLLKNNFSGLLKPIIETAANLFYIYILKAWSLIFGSSEIALRASSVLVSLLSIIVIYKLAVLWFNQRTAYWVAFLLTINYFSIFYAIQARPYSLIILLSLFSYYYFSKCLERRSVFNLSAYIIFTLIGVYTHPWFFLLLIAQASYLGQQKKFKRPDILWAQLFIILMFFPWLKNLYSYGSSGVSSFIGPTTPGILWETFYYFTFPATYFYIFILLVILFSRLFLVEVSADRIYLRVQKINIRQINKNYFLTISYFIIPLLVAFFISLWRPFYLAGRYDAIALPPLILLLAVIFSKLKNRIIIFAVVFVLITSSFLAVKNEQTDILSYKYNDRIAAEILLSKLNKNDMIIYTDLSRPTFDYYLPRLNKDNLKFTSISFPEEMSTHPIYQDLNKLLNNRAAIEKEAEDLVVHFKQEKTGKIWAVLNASNPASQIIYEQLKNNFQITEEIDLSSLASPMHFQFIVGYR